MLSAEKNSKKEFCFSPEEHISLAVLDFPFRTHNGRRASSLYLFRHPFQTRVLLSLSGIMRNFHILRDRDGLTGQEVLELIWS